MFDNTSLIKRLQGLGIALGLIGVGFVAAGGFPKPQRILVTLNDQGQVGRSIMSAP